jgi:hypothetical protein
VSGQATPPARTPNPDLRKAWGISVAKGRIAPTTAIPKEPDFFNAKNSSVSFHRGVPGQIDEKWVRIEKVIKMKLIRCLLCILVIFLLTACNSSFTEEDIGRIYRQWVATLFEEEDSSPQTTPGQTRVPLVEVSTNQDSTPVVSLPLITVNANICNLAVSGMPVDITIPDGTRLRPGQSFSKTWRLVNAGSCPWSQGYSAVWFSGELLTQSRIQFLRSVVLPGQSVDITIEMVAPKKPGLFQSNWKLSDPNANLFGIGPNGDAPFWVRIEVIEELSSPTPAVTPTVTQAPDVYYQGDFQLILDDMVNLNTGEINTGTQDDLGFVINDAGVRMLVVEGSTRFLRFGPEQPTDRDCRSLALSADPIELDELAVGDYVCYRTGQALPGYLRLSEADLEENILVLQFVTWAVP